MRCGWRGRTHAHAVIARQARTAGMSGSRRRRWPEGDRARCACISMAMSLYESPTASVRNPRSWKAARERRLPCGGTQPVAGNPSRRPPLAHAQNRGEPQLGQHGVHKFVEAVGNDDQGNNATHFVEKVACARQQVQAGDHRLNVL